MAEDAGSGPQARAPASMNHAAELAQLEIRVQSAAGAAGEAWLELLHEPAAGPAQVARHRTDAQGRLTLALAPGSARAVAWLADSAALPAATTLLAGQSAQLELTLAPAFPVAGRVVDARNGAPVAGAEIAIWTFAERDVVTSAADGTFRHPRFPACAAAQQLAARAAGYGQAVRYLRIDAAGNWKLPAARAGEDSVRGAGTPWVELELVPELRVHGRVLDAFERPLAGARVSAEGFFHALPSVASRDLAVGTSDADGRFTLAGLRSDIGHSLLIEAAGHAAEPRELAPASLHELGELVLALETVLAGVVLDGDGVPQPGIEVVLHTHAPTEALPASTLDVGARLQGIERRTRSDAHGSFLFEHLAARTVTLQVAADAALPWRAEIQARADGSFPAATITLAPAPAVALRDYAPR